MTRPPIAELEAWSSTTKLPDTFRINAGEVVSDVPRFVQSQIRIYKANPTTKEGLNCLDRLVMLKGSMDSKLSEI